MSTGLSERRSSKPLPMECNHHVPKPVSIEHERVLYNRKILQPLFTGESSLTVSYGLRNVHWRLHVPSVSQSAVKPRWERLVDWGRLERIRKNSEAMITAGDPSATSRTLPCPTGFISQCMNYQAYHIFARGYGWLQPATSSAAHVTDGSILSGSGCAFRAHYADSVYTAAS